MDELNFIKMKTSALKKALLMKWKDKPQSGRIYLLIKYLKMNFYVEYIKNS